MELMFAPLKKYADFQGRARRSEYWLFYLFQIIVYVILMVLIGVTGGFNDPEGAGMFGSVFGILYILFALGLLVPNLAVTVRRLHDTDRSGWWIFISLVPFIGGIWLLVLTVLDGTPGTNKFGPDPKGRGDSNAAQVFA
ncbi:MAG: DUF805 domain-containing protein [Caulobacter sp.]|nr:DUF805 domain-containing protein [Caulobacter sp.]